MRVALLGLTLALVWFLIINFVTSIAVVAVAPFVRRAERIRSGAPAGLLLALRLGPAAVAIIFALFAFFPTFLRLEPRDAIEGIGPLLLAGAGLALVLIGAGCRRGLLIGRDAAQCRRRWMREGEPLAIGAPFATWVIRGLVPAISLVGIRRPRLFLARPVLEALTPGELQAVIRHEVGHQRAGDNLARCLMAWSPDFLRATSTGAWLEREWARAAELRADGLADRGDAAGRLDLASALVKVARIMPAASSISAVASTLHDGGDIAMRVRRLTDGPEHNRAGAIEPRGYVFAAATAVFLMVAGAIVLWPQAARVIQMLTELVVRVAR